MDLVLSEGIDMLQYNHVGHRETEIAVPIDSVLYFVSFMVTDMHSTDTHYRYLVVK